MTLLKHESKRRYQNDPDSEYEINGGNKTKMFHVHTHQAVAIGYIGPMQGEEVIDN